MVIYSFFLLDKVKLSTSPIIGYEKAAEIAKQAYKENRPVLDVAAEKTDLSRKQLEKLLDPIILTKGF